MNTIPPHYVKIGHEWFSPSDRRVRALNEPACDENCEICSGEYCNVHFTDPCDCDVIQRHYGNDTAVTKPQPKPAKRLRQSSKAMNKLEKAFYEKLKQDQCVDRIYVQAVKFQLCNGVWYCPDFFVVQIHDHQIAYETKGFMRDDAAIKLKMAAKEFPRITWKLVWKDKKTGQWMEQHVLP